MSEITVGRFYINRYDLRMAKRNNGEFENFGYSSFATPPEK